MPGFMKNKIFKKAAKKIEGAMPDLKTFAVDNDKAYIALMKTIKEINEKRKKKRKYVITID